MTRVDARQRLRGMVRVHESQKSAAKALGISQQYLCDLLKGRRPFSARVLQKLGLQQVIVVRNVA